MAADFLAEAERAGVRRIVDLGGMRPAGKVSRHLRSRLATGEVLRGGSVSTPVSTIELQAGMIIGRGSESWRIVRDLAMRSPVMVLPRGWRGCAACDRSSWRFRWSRRTCRATGSSWSPGPTRTWPPSWSRGSPAIWWPADRGFWALFPEHQLIPFDHAAERALAEDERDLSFLARASERVIRACARPAQR